MNGLMAVLLVVFLSCVGALADYLLKVAGNGKEFIDFKFFFPGFIIFSSMAICWFYVFKYVKFSTIGVVYGISTIILFALIGVFFLGEKLNAQEIVGIIAGIFSIILLARFA